MQICDNGLTRNSSSGKWVGVGRGTLDESIRDPEIKYYQGNILVSLKQYS